MKTPHLTDRLTGRALNGAAGFVLACFLALGFFADTLAAAADRCAACGNLIVKKFYLAQDKLTQQKVSICANCEFASPVCFFCGLPVNTNDYLSLPDGRSLCAREAKTAVLQDAEAVRVCFETRDALDRLFSRFLALPATNVIVDMMDRVHLQELFKFAGNDFACPNVWGCLETRTNHQCLEHHLSLLTGLPLENFRATCAHEYGHAWLNENLPPGRRQALSQDANEGFCELLAYLLMVSQADESVAGQILRNAYTRGQIQLFIAAEKTFGFNEVLDWMKYGADARLLAGEPNRIKNLRQPSVPGAPAPNSRAGPPGSALQPAAFAASEPEALALKAIFWNKVHPSAIINGRTFEPREQGNVRLGQSTRIVRCLEIRSNSVLIQVQGESFPRELTLPLH